MPFDLDHPYTYLMDDVRFKITDTDTSADTKYYGFTDKNGEWYIMKEVTTLGTFRYARGTTNYSTNWTGRAGLTYSYYYEVF